MQQTDRVNFNVWLVARGQEAEDLASALRMYAMGHNLTVLEDEVAYRQIAEDVRLDADRYPSLVLRFIANQSRLGEEFLTLTKASSAFRHVPVILFFSCLSKDEVRNLYQQGAASVIRLPIKFDGVVAVMRVMEEYWFRAAAPPPNDGALRSIWTK